MNSHLTSALQLWEPHIHSFVELNPHARGHETNVSADLSGITMGVKDIIDVEGMRTRNGSEACRRTEPAAADANVVASLRKAGVHVIGKTTTTEFAFTDPTNCRNPYDLTRTPGGSSSGSGAAVAAGIVDMALGTQTAGSLCRPAAYCGVVGFKPSFGALSTHGVTPLAASFDTVGVIARSIEIARQSFCAMTGPAPAHNQKEFEIVSALLPTQTCAQTEMLAAFLDASNALRQENTSVRDFTITADINGIVAAHRIVMNAEAAHAHRHLMSSETMALLRPNFRDALETGAATCTTALEDSRELLSRAREMFWQQLNGIDMVLTLAVPDAAPLLDGTTGFQDWLTPWTVFGGPLVCLPWGLDSLGRPKSIMLAAHPGKDMDALAVAEHLERLAPVLPRPTLPSGPG